MQSEHYGSVFQMLDERLEAIEQGMNSVKTDVAVIKDRQTNLIVDLSVVKTTIYGNGHPGLKEKLALVWQRVALISAGIGLFAAGSVSLMFNAITKK